MIDPNEINTTRVGQLPSANINLTNNIAHEVGTDLKRATIEDLSIFIAAYIGASDGVGFRAVTVTDGQTLPTTTNQEFILVGKGTFYNVNGGQTIVTTNELNAIVSNGSYWFIGVEIPVNVELAGIVQTIRQGEISTAPSEAAVFSALNLKANDNEVVKLTGTQTITGDKFFTKQIKVGNGTLLQPSLTFYDEASSDTGFNHNTDGRIDVVLNGVIKSSFNLNSFDINTPINIESATTIGNELILNSSGNTNLFFQQSGVTKWIVGYIPSISGFRFSNGVSDILTLANTGAATFASSVTATAFIGAGSSLTGLTKTQVGLSLVPNTDFTSAVAANTAKISFDSTSSTRLANTSGTNSGDQDISGKANLTSPALTGTPTAPTATDGNNTTQIATTAFVLANTTALPYKVITALISQSGTNAPTATVLENTLGPISFGYVSLGVYSVILSGGVSFTIDKTTVLCTKQYSGTIGVVFSGNRDTNSQVSISTGSTNGAVNGQLTNATIEIRVYN